MTNHIGPHMNVLSRLVSSALEHWPGGGAAGKDFAEESLLLEVRDIHADRGIAHAYTATGQKYLIKEGTVDLRKLKTGQSVRGTADRYHLVTKLKLL